MDKNKKIEFFALWVKRTGDGENFFSGTLGGNRVLIFKNKYKKADNHPDYRAYLAPIERTATKPDKSDFAAPEMTSGDFDAMSETDIPF